MLAVMGTSTCHVMNGEVLAEVPGMCGVVEGGITPGLLGYEAGQSGVGDIFAWFVEQQLPGGYLDEAATRGLDAHEYLSELARPGARRARARRARLAQRQPLRPRRPRAQRRRRRADARHAPEDVYRALIEATAFGARTIVETFESRACPCASSPSPAGWSRTRC